MRSPMFRLVSGLQKQTVLVTLVQLIAETQVIRQP
jgi:hypothetical protein